MNFQEELVFEANKLIKRFERYASDLRDDDKRISRRTGIPTTGNVLRPNYWTIDPSFDPFHVRANNEAIARSVNFKLRTGTYIPYNPIEYEVPKKDGSMRPVSVFTVADSAVSKRVYRSLMDKNRAKIPIVGLNKNHHKTPAIAGATAYPRAEIALNAKT